MTPPLPTGFRIAVDPTTRQLAGDLLYGGSPARVLRLTPAGVAAWQRLRCGPVTDRSSGALARRLTDAGLAHPCPPAAVATPEATVVIPVRDRAVQLGRCLAALGGDHPVVVVDDGSDDPTAVATVAGRYGARLLAHTTNRGPAAARNTALTVVHTEVIAFVDSDCLPAPGWVDALAAHLADPLVAAVAPRITAIAADSSAGRYARAAGGLDLGGTPARVAPNTRVSYVPTAALVARRAALLGVALLGAALGGAVRDGAVFDPALRTGEDVDLVWRLHEAGWRVRYEPAVTVGHEEPATWRNLLARRFRYGRSAAPLSTRHPSAVTHLVLHPWPAVTLAALFARRPGLAAAAFCGSVLTMVHTLRRAGVPTRGVVRAMLIAVHQTWLGVGRYGTRFGAPVLVLVMARPGGRTGTNRWGHRIAAASLLLGPPLTTWAERRPDLGPTRFVLGTLADEVAYGGGVLASCLTSRTSVPVRPRISRRHVRIDRAT